MSLQHDFNEASRYISSYGCSNWGEDEDTVKDCGGWQLTDFDTWHTCPLHYKGQMHPEDNEETWIRIQEKVAEKYADKSQDFRDGAAHALITQQEEASLSSWEYEQHLKKRKSKKTLISKQDMDVPF